MPSFNYASLFLLLFVLLNFWAAPAAAQNPHYTFRYLSISDGLSQSSVLAIAQDAKGLMWFGTRDGLNKFDGHKFTVYKHNNTDSTSISNNDITKLLVDRQGDIWIATFNGLNKYDYRQDRFTSFLNNQSDNASISDNSIWSICEARNGDVWVGTAKGLNRYNRQTNTFQRFFHDPADPHSISDNFILDILQDKAGTIWVATARGLNKINQTASGNYRFTHFLHHPANPESISDNSTQTLAEDAQGNLWIGTKQGGLNKLNKRTGTFQAFKHNPEQSSSISNNDVRALAFDKAGKLWIGTYGGLNLLEGRGERFTRMLNDKDVAGSLSRNSVKSIHIDLSGTVWVGTYNGGINLLSPQNKNFRNYTYKSNAGGLNFDVISGMAEDRAGNIYIGTEGGGINYLNRNTRQMTNIKKSSTGNSITSNNIKSLYLDEKEQLWVGTFGAGLNILNPGTGVNKVYRKQPENRFSLNDDNIYSIVPESDSLYWLGTYGGGLNLFNRYTGRFRAMTESSGHALTHNLVRTVLKDSKGNLWVGTQYGLNWLAAGLAAKASGTFTHYFYDESKKTGEDILTVFEDSRNRIWVGTNVSGLNYLEPGTGVFVHYDLSGITGSTGNVVHSILEDGNRNLWISTNQGLLQLNPDKKTFKRYDEADGVVSNEFNNNSALRTRNGQMFFGSLAGITSFHPDSLTTNTFAPPVVLTDFKLFGQSVKVGGEQGVLDQHIAATKELVLDYDQAIFTIEFAIPNYINSRKNQYAYRLKGLETNWNYTSSTSATYTIQKSGTYVFEVKGANSDGIWSDEVTTLQVQVKPAPWRTWWAFLFYAGVIMVALYLLVKVIMSRSKLLHELELEHLNLERQESLNQTKLQFFTNVSHEFRTPLTLILGPLEQIIANFKGDKLAYRQLQTVEKNANRLLRLIDELMDFRKYENQHLQLKAAEGDIVAFVEEVFLSFKQYAHTLNFEYVFKSDQDSILVWFDREKMERVVSNLISNAFKYTPAGGHIKVQVRQVPEGVEIKIKDNGVGIGAEHLEKIFDSFYEVDQSDRLVMTKYNKGTGIGLALAKGIVNLHGGKITVESTRNEGSTFAVILPLGKAHLPQDQLATNGWDADNLANYKQESYLLPDAEAQEEHADKHNRFIPTILVVEDNEDVRKFIAQLFRDVYNVLEAPNGKEGLEVALQQVPDLIISDVMMPEMDGIEFCARAKSNLKTSHIPFILLTARTSHVYKHEGLETGADDYINKPFNVKELQIKVRNQLNTQRKLKERFANESVVKPSEITVTSLDEKLLERALAIVEENISNDTFDIATFCEELGVSRTMLFTKIKAWTNLTPNDFIQVMRLKRAAQLLEQNKLNVSQVCFEVGFKNPKYFSKCFQRQFGETPTAYAKKFVQVEEA